MEEMTTEMGMVEQLEVVALVKLAQLNVPTDVQELLVRGDPMSGVAPHALRSAIVAVLECLRTPTRPMIFYGMDAMARDDLEPTEEEFARGFIAAIDAALSPARGDEP